MDNKIIEAIRYAMVPYRINLKAGDRLVLLADTGTDPAVTQAFMAAALALDIKPYLIMSPPVLFHHDSPDQAVVDAIAAADPDIVHLITTKAVLHSSAIHRFQVQTGKPIIASEEISIEMLRGGGVSADYDTMNVLAAKLTKIYTDGARLHVTSDNGTDLVADITGRPGYICAGKIVRNAGCELYACAFPDGEVGIAPVEGTANGTIVWDGSMHHVGLISDPIKATFVDGRCVDISGGAEARRLETYLDAHGDDGARLLCEAAIGLNDKIALSGVVREDKKKAGTMHLALGMNTDVGGTIDSRLHIDGVLRRPTLHVDDLLVVDNGVLQIK
ncbi:aminopeptidase [Rhodococcus sp. T2V]|uniref:aminopeptidase n=1 Tax=Rhodococcus sp. T2V TaxID=3034164 RepID=UPI0023E24377|nr:aminopeptidase [Rhodococcus sp. T2V]MDF3311471.1 aminopeptidase [Rhodococcus sp. T2V]